MQMHESVELGKPGIYLTEVTKTPQKKSSAFELLNSYMNEGKSKSQEVSQKGVDRLDFAFLDVLNLDSQIKKYIESKGY